MRITLPDGNTLQAQPGDSARDVAQQIGEKLAQAAIGARVAPGPAPAPGTDTGTETETGTGTDSAQSGSPRVLTAENSRLIDADRPLDHALGEGVDACTLAIVTAPRIDKKTGRGKFRDDQHEKDALYLLRHSCAHVMAEAIEKLWPDTQLAYGPPLDHGFYYDIALNTPISSDDFAKIEAEMARIVAEDRPMLRYELDADTGWTKLEAEGNKYKLDNAKQAFEKGSQTLSFYVTGEAQGFTPWAAATIPPRIDAWEDLCQGPHVDRTSRLGLGGVDPNDPATYPFKVTSIAQSHWHGDITSDAFQRVYGTAFFTRADLEHRLAQLEEARQRDHRVLGRRLGLFEIDDQAGQGLVLWKPNGAVVRQELQNFILEHLERQGYKQVFTPHIGKLDLYRTSGHFPYYADSQFPPLVDRDTIKALAEEGCTCAELSNRISAGEVEGYLLKPMNCPHHIRIYASDKHSYRDLPIRLAEFGTVYRWEQSGELGGMTRVRGFTQDDAHLFVTPEQLDAEVAGCLELVKIVFKTLGMDDYRVRVGLRDPDSTKYVGKPGDWDAAERACRKAAESLGAPFSAEPGEAAFYGPKIDFVVKDVIGREWQLGTVQVDYQLPQRFELEYAGSDNTAHRPIMIHRAPFGSMERFIGVLIEHFNGAFPLWLSPEQCRVLPISDKFNDYAALVLNALKHHGLRASIDASNERVNAKVKVGVEDKVPYLLIVGGKDEEAGTVSVRHRAAGDTGAEPLEAFVERVVAERDKRQLS